MTGTCCRERRWSPLTPNAGVGIIQMQKPRLFCLRMSREAASMVADRRFDLLVRLGL